MRTWFVIPAAGSGRRIGGDRPKQYQLLAGKPLLQHTLDRLNAVPEIAGGVIALAAGDPYWSEIHAPDTWSLQTCVGGAERNDSVLAALDHLSAIADANDWVLVHDAARPRCARAPWIVVARAHDAGRSEAAPGESARATTVRRPLKEPRSGSFSRPACARDR